MAKEQWINFFLVLGVLLCIHTAVLLNDSYDYRPKFMCSVVS